MLLVLRLYAAAGKPKIMNAVRRLPLALLLCLACLLTGRQGAFGQLTQVRRPEPVAPSHVLIVINRQSPDSVAIGSYYIEKRRIPAANVCKISCVTTEECARHDYETQIETFVAAFLTNRPNIDFVVLTKGIPIRIQDGLGVDSSLACLGLPVRAIHMANPYFAKMGRFTFAEYHFRPVTRLDGYTRADCLKLVDNSLAARPVRGPFLLHAGPGHDSGGYEVVTNGIRSADAALKAKGFQTLYDTDKKFAGGKNLMGYYSWGSNDTFFDKAAYNSLTFVPGALAETAVSTSGRTFSDPKAFGQSLIADLIAQGVTGCKGYVSEPYADSMAHAGLLFDRYTVGFNLAESFYMASRYLAWKDVVIGDPLCAPYALPAPPKP